MARAITGIGLAFILGVAMAETPQPEKKPVLGMTLYIIRSEQIVPRKEFLVYLDEHLEYQFKIEAEGTLFAAGPLVADGDPSPKGVGVIVVRADSFEHARAVADADPFHKRKLKRYTLNRWIVNEGGINLRVKFSDSSIEIQ